MLVYRNDKRLNKRKSLKKMEKLGWKTKHEGKKINALKIGKDGKMTIVMMMVALSNGLMKCWLP